MFEKLKLSMHVSRSRHFAKEVKRLVAILKHDHVELEEDDKKIAAAIQAGDAQAVHDEFDRFIQLCTKDAKAISTMNEDEFIIEHRVIQAMGEIETKLRKLADNNVLHKIAEGKSKESHLAYEALDADVKQVHNLIEQTVNWMRAERNRSRDLKRDHQHMRDRSVWSDEWLIRQMKVKAIHQADESSKKSRLKKDVFNDIEKIIQLLGSQHDNETEAGIVKNINKFVKRLQSQLDEYLEHMKNELKDAIDIERKLIVLAFRIKDMNKKELELLGMIMSQSYPEHLAEDIRIQEEEYIKTLTEEDRRDYHYTRTLLREARKAA